MDRFKFPLFLTIFVLSFLPLPPSSNIYATEYYAFRSGGSDCTLCHTDPKTGSLNQIGASFQRNGYRYPFTWEEMLLYLLSGLTLFLMVFGFYRRFRLWHLGRSEGKWNQWKERWKGAVLYVFGHRTTLRSLFPGISHLLLFGSLFILSLTVTTILIQEYLYFPLWRTRFVDSKTYPFLRLILDLFGMAGCAGTILLTFRRYIQRPRELDHQWTDAISLALLFLIFLTGFLLTGIRNQLYQSAWSQWAPVASATASIFREFVVEQSGLKISFSIIWWTHLFLSFTFLSYIPFSRLFHLLSSPLNIFFRNLEAKGALPFLDLEIQEI